MLYIGGLALRVAVAVQRALAVVVLGIVAFLCPTGDVQAGPAVLFTVDVESNEAFPLPRQIEAACNDGSRCGLMEIARLLKARGVAGTFFLNVYEYASWGQSAMQDIAVKLQLAGQDVALHTHPDATYDASRPFMYQYSVEEQTAIIRDGMQLLTAWTGRAVVAHRAGSYSADPHTLEALQRNGVRVDSSLFWGHPQCRLLGLGLPRNSPSSVGKVGEIPVTVYQREELPRFFGSIFAPVRSVRKIDANWFLDEEEARSALDAVIATDPPFVVVFLHSFSLMEGAGNDGMPSPDQRARDNLQAILDHLIEKHLQFVTMREIAESPTLVAATLDQDIVPRVAVQVGLHRYLWHRLRMAGAGVLIIGCVLLTFLAAVVMLIVLRWRRRKWSAARPQAAAR